MNMTAPLLWNLLSTGICLLCGGLTMFLPGLWYSPEVFAFFTFGWVAYWQADNLAVLGVDSSVFCRGVREGNRKTEGFLLSGLLIVCVSSLLVSAGMVGLSFLYAGGFRTALCIAACIIPVYAVNKVMLRYAYASSFAGTAAAGRVLCCAGTLVSLFVFYVLGFDGVYLMMIFIPGEILLFIWLSLRFCTLFPRAFYGTAVNLFKMGKEHFLFGVRVFGGKFVFEMNFRMALFILPLLSIPAVQIGMYGAALLFVDCLLQAAAVIQSVLGPEIVALYEKNHRELELKRKEGKIARFSFLLFVFFMLFSLLALFTGYLTKILPLNSVYIQCIPFLLCLYAGMLFYAPAAPFGFLLPAFGYPGLNTILFSCVTCLHIIIFVPLVLLFGILGAAAAGAGCFISLGLVILWSMKRIKKEFSQKTGGEASGEV